METTIAGCRVNECSRRAFMGHEEIVLPMLVQNFSSTEELGKFTHCLNGKFEVNDLSNTAVFGFTSGCYSGVQRMNFEKIYVGSILDTWIQVPEIAAAIDALGKAYAFFQETSESPIEDAFVRRCRFVARKQLGRFYHEVDLETETNQTTHARDVLSAFIRASFVTLDCDCYRAIYGDYAHPEHGLGDLDCHFNVYAIWLEQEGVVRAWTRVRYSPK